MLSNQDLVRQRLEIGNKTALWSKKVRKLEMNLWISGLQNADKAP